MVVSFLFLSFFSFYSLEGTEQKILRYLAHHGPVVTAVDATNWQFYVGGVIQWNCDANNNHAVQVQPNF